VPARRKSLRAGVRGRKPREPPCLTRSARALGRTGALIAISSLIHAARAARFDGFFVGTAIPYAALGGPAGQGNYWIQ
jgi:hypothetical protein